MAVAKLGCFSLDVESAPKSGPFLLLLLSPFSSLPPPSLSVSCFCPVSKHIYPVCSATLIAILLPYACLLLFYFFQVWDLLASPDTWRPSHITSSCASYLSATDKRQRAGISLSCSRLTSHDTSLCFPQGHSYILESSTTLVLPQQREIS